MIGLRLIDQKKINMIKYGVFVARCQPFHIGHMHIIDKIIEDGLQPVIMLDSANCTDLIKNPYSIHSRATMIRLIYPDILIGAINDYDKYEDWLSALLMYIKHLTTTHIKSSTIYLHEKLEDLHDFTFRGTDYTNESYCKMYEIEGLHTTTLPISDIQIRAKAIREDLEGNKEFLHPEVYKYIKGLQC